MSGLVPSVHGIKPFGVVYINKSSGLPVYTVRANRDIFGRLLIVSKALYVNVNQSSPHNRANIHAMCILVAVKTELLAELETTVDVLPILHPIEHNWYVLSLNIPLNSQNATLFYDTRFVEYAEKAYFRTTYFYM